MPLVTNCKDQWNHVKSLIHNTDDGQSKETKSNQTFGTLTSFFSFILYKLLVRLLLVYYQIGLALDVHRYWHWYILVQLQVMQYFPKQHHLYGCIAAKYQQYFNMLSQQVKLQYLLHLKVHRGKQQSNSFRENDHSIYHWSYDRACSWRIFRSQ